MVLPWRCHTSVDGIESLKTAMEFRLLRAVLLLTAALSQGAQATETIVGITATKAEVENTRLQAGFKLFTVIMPSERFGVEIAHGKYGEHEEEGLEFSSTNLALIATTAGDGVDAYGKLGIAMWDVDKHDYWYGQSYSVDGEDTLIGLGVNVKAHRASIKLELEAIDASSGSVVSFNIGFGFAF